MTLQELEHLMRPSSIYRPQLIDKMDTNGNRIFTLKITRQKAAQRVPKEVALKFIDKFRGYTILIGFSKNSDMYIIKDAHVYNDRKKFLDAVGEPSVQ